MPIRLFFTLLMVALVGANLLVSTAAEPSPELLKEGEALYLGAGSCAACHMVDGKGQPGSVPPLAKSEWLEDTDRSVAISLRGMAGPVKVNGKRYFSAMPPQLMFDDDKLAKILTYVNHSWGNNYETVTSERVAKARASLPIAVYTPHTILKAFPFKNKQLAKRNGTYKLDYDDQLTNVVDPVVYRTFMPGASPAAFAVALPGNHYYCWDAGECRLRYVWTKGGFIRGNKVHWSSNGKPVAEFNGKPYYRARSSLLKEADYAHLADSNRREPFYDTTEADDFPFEIEGVEGKPKYLGYRLIDKYPTFRYQFGAYAISETLKVNAGKNGVTRTFTVQPATDLKLNLTLSDTSKTESSAGILNEDGSLDISAASSESFTVNIINLIPAVPAN